MKKIGIALAGISLALLAASAAQATVFALDITYWSGIGSPPANPAEEDFAHLLVDDEWGGSISNHGRPTGIWSYAAGDFFGLPFHDFDIDIYNDYWGGGVTIVPFAEDGWPDYDFTLDIWGPSLLSGEAGDYHITPGTYVLDGGYDGLFSMTVSVAPAAAVPEPAAWAMMVGGFAAIGAAMRRRQRTVVSFG